MLHFSFFFILLSLFLSRVLANKLPVFVPPVNTHAPVVFAAFNNPFRISYSILKWRRIFNNNNDKNEIEI